MNRTALWKHLRTVTSLICGMYALALLLYLATRFLPFARPWWLAFVDNFMTWYFLPVLVLLPLALLVRAKRGVLLLLPLLVIGLLRYAPYFVPRAQAQPDAPALRVVTFNMSGGFYAQDNTRLGQLPAYIDELDADIIAFQETPTHLSAGDDGLFGSAAAYPYQIGANRDHLPSVTLSQLPVITADIIPRMLDTDRPGYQRLVIDFNGVPFAFYNVHLLSPRRDNPHPEIPVALVSYFWNAAHYDETLRNRQINYLVRLLEQERLPFIVAGDFNTSDQSLLYPQLANIMHDSFWQAGIGFGTSFPARQSGQDWWRQLPPLVRIDYIWHSADWYTVSAALLPSFGSEHLPLIATVSLKDTLNPS